MNSKLKTVVTGIIWITMMALLCQCTSWILSATLQITFYVEDDIYSVDDNVEMASVDLTENEDWDEHHEEVTGIQRAAFATWVINRSSIDAAAQFYVSTNCTLTTDTQVENEATLVLDGISVPANDSIYVTAEESYQYIQHQDELFDIMLEGAFCLYCIAEESPFAIEVPESVAVVIDFTYTPE
jgi:hypothetical protein